MKKSISDQVASLAAPIVEQLSLKLVAVTYTKEGPNWFLRVAIDSTTGVNLDDCEAVSERLSEVLDAKDPISGPYFLEVSSPGAERSLKDEDDVKQAVGTGVYVTTYEPISGQKSFEGVLKSFTDGVLTIEGKVKTKSITYAVPYEKVASARRSILI
ncbi:ribosome maturation factor RimP [Shouchella lonarensis]|uniref:Ribosome maturation factor RimP n=1 Tax=Shouchella lonarensis TaxID=1464122 RepID=A0A1G6H7U6_9BACI|nr:ribosome maturation factor RimP [Shouchella lonarensis]SDB90233.1 ribosome maturation factor RimP [Shouchella lonarensis]